MIGITGAPAARATGYLWPYTQMIVRYRTSSEDYVRRMEDILVDEYEDYCDNIISGGGGPVSGPPYYLYIVR